MSGPTFREGSDILVADLVELYSSVEWSVYSEDPERLGSALANSTYVVSAWTEGDPSRLVGLARVVSDDESIAYLQDLLVRPGFRRQGIGSELLAQCSERFRHVRQLVLLTDVDPGLIAFYRNVGFDQVGEGAASPLTTFVRMREH